MTVLEWVFVIGALAAAGWFWSFLFREKHQAFHCVGCGKCAAAGECVLMREERERKLALERKRAMKKGEKPREPS